jgi:hypothetical protein
MILAPTEHVTFHMFLVVLFFFFGVAAVPFLVWVVLFCLLLAGPLCFLLFVVPLTLFLLSLGLLPKLALARIEAGVMPEKVVFRFEIAVIISVVLISSFLASLTLIIWILIWITSALALLC